MHGIPAWLPGLALLAVVLFVMLQRIEQRLADIHRLLLADRSPSVADGRAALAKRIAPLVRQGQTIQAIRIVRETLACPLVEAKRFVDDMKAHMS